MILINAFLNIYCQKWLNKKYMQQHQNKNISKYFTSMRVGICVYEELLLFTHGGITIVCYQNSVV